jgi:hypothetical protein
MRTSKNLQATIQLHEVKVEGRRMTLRADLQVELPMPAQNERLPRALERAIEDAGQKLKRQLFRQAVEQADLELLLARRRGKGGQGLRCRGTTGYTFKTVFGTVAVRRRRVEHPADGSTEVPSAHAWQTPQQVCLTPGLRDALCDGMLEQSAQATVTALEERAGEEGLVSKTTVLEVVHQEGQRLAEANEGRAEQALAAHPEAAPLLLPAVAEAGPAEAGPRETPPAEDDPDEPAPPVGFPGALAEAEAVAREQPRQVDSGWVLVEPDEVKVHAQACTGRKEVLVYTAAVLLAGRAWHFSATSAQALVRQVGGLLAALGVHQGQRRLLFLGDGARWIREWFEGLRVAGKAMVLCWYHLVKRCGQLLSLACRGRAHRAEVQHAVLGHLWHGRVDEALAELRGRAEQMKNEGALAELLGYLESRRPYLPDYAARRAAGLWIASTRVEKFNDWAVSARCKHQGMDWTAEGVGALAALEAARRNGELQAWRKTGRLPRWQAPELAQAA